jgi:lysophospholipase L1-like esterase
MSGGVPQDYVIEVSPDGSAGSWTQAVMITGHAWAESAHLVPFQGKSWLRVTVTRIDNPNNQVWLDEIDVHDASNSPFDTWMFLGDSITGLSYARGAPQQPSFAENIHATFPAYFPLMVVGGVGGKASDYGLMYIDEWLTDFPDMHFWILGYGTNESGGNDSTMYQARMQTLVDKISAKGHIALIPHIPYQPKNPNVPIYNAGVDAVVAKNSLLPGPDFYGWFQSHPDELADGVHPTPVGEVAMNRMWAEAVARLYSK